MAAAARWFEADHELDVVVMLDDWTRPVGLVDRGHYLGVLRIEQLVHRLLAGTGSWAAVRILALTWATRLSGMLTMPWSARAWRATAIRHLRWLGVDLPSPLLSAGLPAG